MTITVVTTWWCKVGAPLPAHPRGNDSGHRLVLRPPHLLCTAVGIDRDGLAVGLQDNFLQKLLGDLHAAPAVSAGPADMPSEFLMEAVAPQLGAEPGSPTQHLEGLALLDDNRLAGLLAASMDELPADDPEAICASLLGTLMGLRQSAVAATDARFEPGGSMAVHVDLTSARPAPEAEPAPADSPGTWAVPLRESLADSMSSSQLPMQLLEKAVSQPERVFGKLLEWAEDCGLHIEGNLPGADVGDHDYFSSVPSPGLPSREGFAPVAEAQTGEPPFSVFLP